LADATLNCVLHPRFASSPVVDRHACSRSHNCVLVWPRTAPLFSTAYLVLMLRARSHAAFTSRAVWARDAPICPLLAC